MVGMGDAEDTGIAEAANDTDESGGECRRQIRQAFGD